jgi:hypothetical protein
VRDNVVGRLLWHWKLVNTWPAADRGGASSTVESFRCGTASQDNAGDFCDPLLRWRRLVVGGSNALTLFFGGGLRLVAVPVGQGTFGLPRRQLLRRLQSVEPCCRLRGPRARERGMLSGGLVVPAHARVPSDSVFFTLSGCQCRCSTMAAFGPARRWPFGVVVSAPQLLSSAVGFAPGFRYSHECSLWVELRFCSCLFCRCLCAVPGHVDVPIQLVSQYS